MSIFVQPVLAKCDNRSVLAKEHPTMGGPSRWFSDSVLKSCGLVGISFDFFVNWNNFILDRDLWVKCPLSLDASDQFQELSNDDLTVNLKLHKGFAEATLFAKKNACEATAIIFDDRQLWSEDSCLILARWPSDKELKYGIDICKVNLRYLSGLIVEKTGMPFKIGSKGLSYGTSRLECHLAKTISPWPGDADLLICKERSLEPVALVEFKKHTDFSKIPFEDQGLGNYYPKPDGPKYDRLGILADQISPGGRIKLFNLYYSTIISDTKVIVEEVVGSPKSLVSGRSLIFDIAADTPEVFSSIIMAMSKASDF